MARTGGALAPLPIDEALPEIIEALRRRSAAVVVAPPGAGKTTRVGPAILASGVLAGSETAEGGRSGSDLAGSGLAVVMLQPRRVAARAAAARIAEEQGWRVGEEVGYQIRFENRTGPTTRLVVMTEGILARRIERDPFLEGVGCVILDEFHERSIHTDLALALLREIREAVRPGLKIVVMSATMEPGPVAEFLGEGGAPAPIVRSTGRAFPVELEHLARAGTEPVWEKVAGAIRGLNGGFERTGHVLAFLPGMGEIRRTAELVRDFEADICVLHSSVSAAEQDRALRPSARRKLILATNIAETSLTIDGVRTVIDAGYARVLVNDARFGFDRLELRRISRASADQRAGRAGRTAPGRCLRLWTRAEDAVLAEAETPEIQRVDLCGPALALRAFGVRDLKSFGWFEAPRPEPLARAERLLAMIGALDEGGALTALGKRLAALPLHPRLGRLLIAGTEAGFRREAALIAAMLAEGGAAGAPGSRRRAARHEADSDLIERLEALEGGEAGEMEPGAVESIRRVARDLERYCEGPKRGAPRDREAAFRKIILEAYPDRVTVRRAGDPARGVMVGGRSVELEPSSMVRRAPLFVSLDPRDTEIGDAARVSIASAIEEGWLKESFPGLCEVRISHRFDGARGKVMSMRERRFAGLLLAEDATGAAADPEGAAAALFEYLARDPARVFDADEDASRWLARVAFLRGAMPELGLPEFDAPALAEILRGACEGCSSLAEVARSGLKARLEGRLEYRQRAALAEHAPEFFHAPSGSRIKIEYEPGAGPSVAVRLQELFGLAQSPRIAGGRAPLVMQLLAPNRRPVQVTSDLASFWNTAYQEVRRELRARYPKHPWPEDPWNAPAVSVGRPRRR